ncbi:radical SAM protein [Telmatobacter sp. DSM 110680]|uniref:Radical SAM protein n=1 Tax=Telmatobacter sp. DSM 110680 TaxID=3036704 RepID=A0AAU7DE62_9BACT
MSDNNQRGSLRPLNIYLGDLTYTTLSLATDAFPLNIGFIAAYAQKIFGGEINLKLFKYIDDLDQAINERPPDILGLTNYPWNFHVGQEMFRMTRAVSPATICVMGGPNIPLEDEDRTQFIKRNSLIDFYAYLEGEEAFAELVKRAMETGVDRAKMKETPIDGFVHRLSDTEVMKGAMLTRRRILDEIPSPYLTGFMDKFFDGKLAPMLETNRGCPFSCTFCHEGNQLISKVNFFSVDRIKDELDYIAAAVRKAPILTSHLMFADPNFAMYERDYEIVEHIEGIQQKQNWPRSIFASTGKNKKERIAKALRKLNGTLSMWMSVQSMDPVVLHEIQRDNISTSEMIALAGVYQELGLPTFSELILGLPGDSYERHVKSISQVVEAGINVVEVYSCMLLNGTKLVTAFSRATHNIGSHFRILPRDFGKLQNGRIAVEIEEVITSTNTLSFQDYQDARKLHLMVAVVYNGGGLSPLLRFMRQNKVPIIGLLQRLVTNIREAPASVQAVFDSFVRLTKDELWESEESLRAYIYAENNYEKLLTGEIGINLIQVHTAMSLAVIDEWVEYIFQTAEAMFGEEVRAHVGEAEILDDIRVFCEGRVHNIFGDDRNEDCPSVELHYDIARWMRSPLATPLSEFKFKSAVRVDFGFSDAKKEEMAAQIKRYGTTATGIGRILIQMGRDRIWREPSSLPAVSRSNELQSSVQTAIQRANVLVEPS